MDSIDVDDSLSGPLNESLALKAFLRMKREERRRNSSTVTSPSPLIDRSVSSPLQERSRDYSVSYDPGSMLEISNIHVSPSSPSGYLDKNDFEEKKQSVMSNSSTSFHSMHAIINSSFQEKIDYQRRLRELQSELNAQKDKVHQLRTENSRLSAATVRLKQKHLPTTLRHLMKHHRRCKLHKSFRVWVEISREQSALMVERCEEYWAGEHRGWIERERMLSRRLRRSVLVSFRFIIRRACMRSIRVAFTRWTRFSPRPTARLESMGAFLSGQHKRTTCRRVLRVWQGKYRIRSVLLGMATRLQGASDRAWKATALRRWTRLMQAARGQKKLYYFMLRMVKSSRAYNCFQKWKHLAFVQYPLKIRVLRALTHRGALRKHNQVQGAFAEWKSFCNWHCVRQKILTRAVARMRGRKKYAAFRRWQEDTERGRKVDIVCLRLGLLYTRCCDLNRRMALVRWRLAVKEICRADERRALRVVEEKADISRAKYRKAYAALQRKNEHIRRTAVANTTLLLRAIKSVACNKYKKLHMRLAFSRWKWTLQTVQSLHDAYRDDYLDRLRIALNKTFLHKQFIAFGLWRDHVARYHQRRAIALKMLRASARRSIRTAFNLWHEVSLTNEIENAEGKLAIYRMRLVIENWRRCVVLRAWMKWKHVNSYSAEMIVALHRLVRRCRCTLLRGALSTWRGATIFNELRLARTRLSRSQSSSETRLRVVFLGLMRRSAQKFFVKWKLYVRRAIEVKKTVLIVVKRNMHQKMHRGFLMWKDFYIKTNFVFNGCRVLRRAFRHVVAFSMMRSFRNWVMFVRSCREVEAEGLVRTLEAVKEELRRARCEHASSLDMIDHLSMKAQSLALVTSMQEDRIVKVLDLNVERRLTRKCFEVLKVIRERRLIGKRQVKKTLRRWAVKSTTASLGFAFDKWRSMVSYVVLKHRTINNTIRRWKFQFYRVAFNKWKTATLIIQMEEMSIALHNKASMRVMNVMTMSTFEHCFQRWKAWMREQVSVKTTCRRLILKMQHRDQHMAMAKWKYVVRHCRNMRRLKFCISRWLRGVVAEAWEAWVTSTARMKHREEKMKSIVTAWYRRAIFAEANAFSKWKLHAFSKSVRSKLSRQQSIKFRRQIITKDLRTVFTEWRRVTFRDIRRHGATSLSSVMDAMPLAGMMYSIFAGRSHYVDDLLLEATRAIQATLPSFTPEVYVLQSPSLLRALVPLDSYGSMFSGRGPGGSYENESIQISSPLSRGSPYQYKLHPRSPSVTYKSVNSDIVPSSVGTVTVIVGRGVVGSCAKTAEFSVSRQAGLNSYDDSIASAVLPLIWGGRLYGVLQLTGAANISMGVGSSVEAASNHSSSQLNAFAGWTVQDAPPMVSQLYEMCVDIGVDLATAIQMGVVISALAQSIASFAEGTRDRIEENERIESIEKQWKGAEEAKEKAFERIEHLERSRLRHFKQSRKLKEEAVIWRNRCLEMKQSLEDYMTRAESFEAYNREVEQLHHSMRQATLEIFGEDGTGQNGDLWTHHEHVDDGTDVESFLVGTPRDIHAMSSRNESKHRSPGMFSPSSGPYNPSNGMV
mmetsp:Transcript_487/g.887  ORF Transcript_487/g.887 Transcript_487/m.887 type:complete len:1559 (+) Transcript_487:67-4743(+)